MNTNGECDRIRDLVPEVALGIAGGDERAAVLTHIAGCAACGRHMAELSSLADDLLTLGPVREPPPGFESRVLEQLSPRSMDRRRRVLLVAALLVIGVVAAAAAVWNATALDRQLAEQYTSVLEAAGGDYFRAVPMADPSGTQVGSVFAYQGHPPWVFGIVEAPPESSDVEVVVISRSDRRVNLQASVDGERITFGRALPISIRAIASIHLVDEFGRSLLVANFSD